MPSKKHNKSRRSSLKTAVDSTFLAATRNTHYPVVVSKTKQCLVPRRAAKTIDLALNGSSTQCIKGIYRDSHREPILSALASSDFKAAGLTGKCSAYFSGTGGPNEDTARDIAEAWGCRTVFDVPELETFSQKKFFENYPFTEASEPWNLGSQKFAQTTEGVAYVAAEGTIKPTSTWLRVEEPTLKANPKVDAIVYLRTFSSYLDLIETAAKEGALSGFTNGMITGFSDELPLSKSQKEALVCVGLYAAFGVPASCFYLAQGLLSDCLPKKILNSALSTLGLGAYACSLLTTNPAYLLTQVAASAITSKPGETVGRKLGEWTKSALSFFKSGNGISAPSTSSHTL